MGNTDMKGTIVGAFRDIGDAGRAVGALEQAGFNSDQVGVLRKGEKDGVNQVRDHGKGATAGATAGLVEGAVLGAAAAFVIPGAGPVIGAGILGTMILGAIAGGATGGIAGALTGIGVSKDEAEHFNKEFEMGRVLVTVRAPGREIEAHQILGRYGMSEFKDGVPAAIDPEVRSRRVEEPAGTRR